MENLQAIEEVGLFPPRFILEVEKKPDCTNNLNRKIRITLFTAENTSTKSVSFKLRVPILITTHTPMPVKFSIEDSPTYLSQVTAIPFHHCDKNRPEHKDIRNYSKKISRHWEHIAHLLDVPHHDVSTIDIDYCLVEQKCAKLFDTWLEKSHCCWCHFIKALYTVGLSQVAEEAKAHLKSSEVEKLNRTELEMYLNHIPDHKLKYFIFRLLSKDSAVKVLEDIRHNDEDNIKKICHAFSKEKDSSWTRVHKALKETKCDDLADIIKASFL